jgi:hypothetical protein
VEDEEEEPVFDAERAASLVGKSVLVGLTRIDANGVEKQVQYFGRITAFDATIVTIRLDSGEERTLPPALDAFEEADPGEYHLRSTGEVVVDPDLISTWTIRAPAENGEDEEEEDERPASYRA